MDKMPLRFHVTRTLNKTFVEVARTLNHRLGGSPNLLYKPMRWV